MSYRSLGDLVIHLLHLLVFVVLTALTMYFFKIPFNIFSLEFVFTILIISACIFSISFIFEERFCLGIVFAISLIWLIVGGIGSLKLFNVEKYRSLVEIEADGNFETDIPKVNSADDIPVVDVITARKLGDRTMGEMEKYISQYEVSNEYNLIFYQGRYYRISPLLYGGFFKYQNSKDVGIPGYVLVDVYTQEAKLVELPKDIHINYSPSAYFGKNLYRYVLSKYPSAMIYGFHFEIDEDGVPFYVVTTIKKTAFIFGASKIDKVILVNAATGEFDSYELDSVPEWVDNVYEADYLMGAVGDKYNLIHGVFNFSEKDVRRTSYSYRDDNGVRQCYFMPKDGEVYLYTGVTSAGGDESNIGFLLCNMRTGVIKYYQSPGAEESSAQGSAEGQVQQYGYKAGQVMLVNINNIETYFMTLKDSQELIKRIALVNKKDYNISVVEETLEQALKVYLKKVKSVDGVTTEGSGLANGKVNFVYNAVIDGTTSFIFTIDNVDGMFISPVDINYEQVMKLSIGSDVEVVFEHSDGYNLVSEISFN